MTSLDGRRPDSGRATRTPEAPPRAGAPDEVTWRTLVLVWGAVVLLFGVVPTHETLQAVAGERESLSTVVGHFAEFALFAFLAGGWLLARPDPPGFARAAALAMLMTVALGAAVELLQGPLPYRDMQLSDLGVDVAGGVAGLAALSCVRARRAWAGRRRTG